MKTSPTILCMAISTHDIPERLLTRHEVEERVGLKRSSIYRLMRDDDFPEPIKVGIRAVRWLETEINSWLASRPRATGDHPKA